MPPVAWLCPSTRSDDAELFAARAGAAARCILRRPGSAICGPRIVGGRLQGRDRRGFTLAEEIRNDMTFIPVETLEQVVAIALSNGQAPTLDGSDIPQQSVTQ